ncbi:MAG: hypothetical protein M3022_02045 [Actinomycetota bacterium]|nr:hypothetical protein [Actinomycetota bacterium]
MADEPQISTLDARLAEIDRRLRTIQTGLTDDAGAEPDPRAGLPPKLAVPEPSERCGRVTRPITVAPRAPAPAALDRAELADEEPALMIAELRGLISDHARLLDAMGELLAAGERLLARADAPAPQERRSSLLPTPAPPAPADPAEVTVTAGPFSSLEAVRDFERALELLPHVASVQARGYEGGDRAVVDVHLSRSNP